MAVKGAAAKQNITQKILDTFPGSFTHEKEIRIPYTENGATGQIKITLTAAKTIVENKEINFNDPPLNSSTTILEQVPNEPSEEEKERLKTLLAELGM